MKTENITLPAHWSSALINGDYSGLEDIETREVNAWIRDNPHYGACLTCSDYPELITFDGLLTECLEYTFPVIYVKNGYLIYPCHAFDRPTEWQKLGLSYTATGYGRKIPTSKMIFLLGKWRRIYCRIFSNIGTCFIMLDGAEVIYAQG